jgi:ABC-type glycerol-3-phosphate transport system substrate-binding protein
VTVAAEAQAKIGHDIVYLTSWLPSDNARNLEPLDDVMGALIEQNGGVNPTVEYLGKSEGHWVAVPATIGSQLQSPCSRIDLMKRYAGIDVQAMYPAGAPPKADDWTLDTFFTAAEACHKAGFPFGIGLGTTEDSVLAAGAIFHSFGAMLVDAKGNVTVNSEPVRQALEYYARLAPFFPARRARVGQRVQQQVADLGPRSTDLESAKRLGCCQARRARNRPAVVDPWHAGWSEGSVCALPAVLLGDMVVQQEQAGG